MLIKIARALQNIKDEKKGFTLIEIMVVIAVLGIIMALVLPNVLDSIDKAKVERDRLNAGRVQGYVYQYRALKGVYPPSASITALESDLKTEKIVNEFPAMEKGAMSYSSSTGIVKYTPTP